MKVNFQSRLILKFMFQCLEQSWYFFWELINPITTYASTTLRDRGVLTHAVFAFSEMSAFFLGGVFIRSFSNSLKC